MLKLKLRGRQSLRELANWIDGVFGQLLIVLLAVVLAVTAGAFA